MLKAIFVLEYLRICPDFCGHVGKNKLKLISKFITSQAG